MELILASNSPRRKELLLDGGYSFKVVVSDFEENCFSSDPFITSVRFAEGKAKAVYDSVADKNNVVVLAADTVVYHDNKILGKPTSRAEAKKTLLSLSGKIHQVITGYAIMSKHFNVVDYDMTEVVFNKLSLERVEEYLNSGLYRGKAGSYGIQDGYNLVKSFKGSLSNVIGLPTERIFPILNGLIKK